MKTPIADFVNEYAKKKGSRFHMPGHKGQAFLGCEVKDITEIAGADALYEADGIIAQSEENATLIFGSEKTLFSTEGSSQCIRAMLHLVTQNWKEENSLCENKPYIIAARNVHKAFLYAVALLDLDVVWIYPKEMHSICSCKVSAEEIETLIKNEITHRDGQTPAGVYVTSPDYLGGQLSVSDIAEVCHRNQTVLMVDNAHGAYLHFLEIKQHPLDLGADICCDSAHKTLPVLTGGAYLHISKNAPKSYVNNAKQAMALFGSTSPSYLTLTSLDLCNKYLYEDYSQKLSETVTRLDTLRTELKKLGLQIEDTDPLKLTIGTPKCSGLKLASELRNLQIEPEYADEDFVVLMATPENADEDFAVLFNALHELSNRDKFFNDQDLIQYDESIKVDDSIKVQGSINTNLSPANKPLICTQVCSIRQAIFATQEVVDVDASLGRICGVPTVGCPPAIPIVVPGESITEEAISLFHHYDIHQISCMK